MRRRPIVLGTLLALAVAGGGQAGCGRAPAGGPGQDLPATFQQRAVQVAYAWRAGGVNQAWRSGFVPLQDLTVVAPEVGFTDDTKQAFLAGWYRLATTLPGASARSGDIRFPDGSTLSVPLLTATEAYRTLDQGDPPCPSAAPAPVRPTPSTPDGSVGHEMPGQCTALSVTAARFGTVSLRTSRGVAGVPAWLFTIAGLPAPIARVAVVPSAVSAVPGPVGGQPSYTPGLVSAQSLRAVDGVTIDYVLGVGACDTDIRPLVYETDGVVVLGGSVHRTAGTCIDLLKLAPATVTLGAPVGTRAVLDGLTGRPLTLRPPP